MVSVDKKTTLNVGVQSSGTVRKSRWRPGLPVSNSHYGLCGRKATFQEDWALDIKRVASPLLHLADILTHKVRRLNSCTVIPSFSTPHWRMADTHSSTGRSTYTYKYTYYTHIIVLTFLHRHHSGAQSPPLAPVTQRLTSRTRWKSRQPNSNCRLCYVWTIRVWTPSWGTSCALSPGGLNSSSEWGAGLLRFYWGWTCSSSWWTEGEDLGPLSR